MENIVFKTGGSSR